MEIPIPLMKKCSFIFNEQNNKYLLAVAAVAVGKPLLALVVAVLQVAQLHTDGGNWLAVVRMLAAHRLGAVDHSWVVRNQLVVVHNLLEAVRNRLGAEHSPLVGNLLATVHTQLVVARMPVAVLMVEVTHNLLEWFLAARKNKCRLFLN